MFKVGACEVHKVAENEYIMFYIGYTDIDTARVFVVKSKDEITNWTRYIGLVICNDYNFLEED